MSEGRPSTEAPPSFDDLRHMRPLIIHLGTRWMGMADQPNPVDIKGSKAKEPQNDAFVHGN